MRPVARNAALIVVAAGLLRCSGSDAPTGGTRPPAGNSGGAVTVVVDGLPIGAEPTLTLTGPDGSPMTLGVRDTVRGLTPGSYVVRPAELVTADDIFASKDSTIAVRVAAESLSVVPVRYDVTSGWIKMETPGLPPGVTVPVTIGAAGFRLQTTAPGVVRPLRPGRYGISAESIEHSGDRYRPNFNGSIDVKAGPSATVATLWYQIATGRLIVTVTGLPNGTIPPIRLSNYFGYRKTVIPGEEIGLLDAGEWDLTADTVVVAGQTYVPLTMFSRAPVAASTQPSRHVLAYAVPNSRLAIQVTGLPDSVPPSIRIFGPNLYAKEFSAATTLTALTPGHYIVHADNLQAASYGPLVSPLEFDLTNDVAQSARFEFTPLFSGFTVNVRGLPPGVDAEIELYGWPFPDGTVITKTTTFDSLPYSEFGITPRPIQLQREGYVAGGPRSVSVFPAVRRQEVNIDYESTGPLNLSVAGVRVMQQAYRLDGTVPLVAGRDAIVTAFISGDTLNGARPTIRARIYHGAALVHTMTFPTTSYSVPTTVALGNVLGWFYARIPGVWVQPGLGVIVDVDPSNLYVEPNEADNVYPASQTPIPVRVAPVRPIAITMVPITQSATGITGVVNATNINSFLDYTRRMLPLGTITTKLRAPFVINGPALSPSDPLTWAEGLNQLAALRAAEGTGDHYYGVVQTAHTSGLTGFGALPGHVAIGWDRRPSGSIIMAHELGHNFGLAHAPCGTTEGVDPAYPYPGGSIGFGGVDLVNLFPYGAGTPDIMGYCGDPWISDYSYQLIFNNVALGSAARPTIAARVESGVLIWGRVQNGRPILEPAFEVDAVPSLPTQPGPHRIEAIADDGTLILGFSFEGERLDHGRNGDRVFAFLVPRSSLRGQTVGGWRLTSNGNSTEIRASNAARTAPRARRTANGRVQLDARDPAVRGVMVRDARTGEILSFGRGTSLNLATPATALNVTVSDGVRSTTHRISVAPR